MTNTICLCLDVDQTLVNSENCDDEGYAFDINGEGYMFNMNVYDLNTHKPTLWYSSLSELKQMCAEKGVALDIHIISSKVTGDADVTIDAVVKMLYPLLQPKLQNGTLVHFQMPKYYLFQTYIQSESKVKYAESILCDGQDNPFFSEEIPVDREILPNIHIPYRNKNAEETSKAAVMQQIEIKLRRQDKQPIAMILVDNQPGYSHEVLLSSTSNCQYKFISAQELEYCQRAPMGYRAGLVTALLTTIKSEIAQCLATISSSSSFGAYNDGWSDSESDTDASSGGSSDNEVGLF